ncbi:hypothetical protein RJ640_027883 [Escallonia rubra]|uniref:Transposase (putative) gypsy type domain-containing protein n=1 Tax=Escallonia rubra TaxID=112253 RepID=A0AA88RJM3_9ASTE|nr:hypothetical protein RJ640_027883 [Escallonia rubra]
MSAEDLLVLIWEYPLPKGWYARLSGLQEPANYGTKFETGIYEEQVKFGYRLPLHPFALRFFDHYRMAPGQLVQNGWRKVVGLIYLVQTSGYKPDEADFMRVFFKICFVKGVANCPGWYYIHSRQRLLNGGPKSNKGWHSRYFFVGRLNKGELPFDRDWNPNSKGKRKEKQPSVELPPAPKKTRVTPSDCSPLIMYASGFAMLSRYEMARQIETLEKRLERAKRKEAEEVKKARDQGICNFLDGNAGEEWLKKRTDDGLEIYEMGFTKAKEIFDECFPDIPLDDFVMPAVVSPSGETAMPSKAGDVTTSHPLEEGPSGDAPEP